MVLELEQRIKKIKKIKRKKGYKFDKLFASKKGKILANHIEETEDFCQKYFFIPMLGRFQLLMYKAIIWMQTEEYENLVKEKIKDEKDKELFKLFQEYQKIDPNWMEWTELDYFTNEEEQIRFFAYLTITIVSYFEIYVRESIDIIQDKLIERSDYYTKKYGVKIKDILKMLNKKETNNAKLQIDNFLKAINIKKSFNKLLLEHELQELPKIIESIIELRNTIIHHKPFPDLSILELPKIKTLEKYISTNLVDMEISYEGENEEFKNSPTILKEIFEELLEIFKPKVKLMSLLQRIPEIVNLYASLFDNIVNIYF